MAMRLIKRNKIIHIGFKAKVDEEVNTYSICNKRYDVADKVFIGDRRDVTCKRCKKKMESIDEDGCIILR